MDRYIFNLFPLYYLTHSWEHKSSKCRWNIAHWFDSVPGSALVSCRNFWKQFTSLGQVPQMFKYQVSMDGGFLIFFICWHVQILNILKCFKDHIFSSVMSINYFLVTRTKLGAFEGLYFPSIRIPLSNLCAKVNSWRDSCLS